MAKKAPAKTTGKKASKKAVAVASRPATKAASPVTLNERLETMASHAKRTANDDDVDVSGVLKKFPDTYAQGDVYITRLDALPSGVTEMKDMQRQLAPGETQGSRHLLRHLDGVKMYKRNSAQECDGPVLQLTQVNDIEHPEHGNLCNIAPGFYAITYQQTGDQMRRRVRD